MHRGRLPACSCRHHQVDGPDRPSGRNACSTGITPSPIMSPAPPHGGTADRDKAGRPRTQDPHHTPPPTTPPPPPPPPHAPPHPRRPRALAADPRKKKGPPPPGRRPAAP